VFSLLSMFGSLLCEGRVGGSSINDTLILDRLRYLVGKNEFDYV